MTWVAIFKALLAAVNVVAGILHDRQLIDAGGRMEAAREMAAIATRLKIGAEIVIQVEAMTDADLDNELRNT